MLPLTIEASRCPPRAGIYAIYCRRSHKTYVGSALDLPLRWTQHQNLLKRGAHYNHRLQYAWKVSGGDLEFHVLEYVSVASELVEREQWWIDLLKSADRGIGLNLCPVAGSVLGKHISDETRAKLRAQKMGHEVSPATREKLRQANLGKKQSAESNELRRQWSTGRKMSADAIARTAAFWTGRKHTDATKHKIRETRARLFAEGKLTPHRTGKPLSLEQRALLSSKRKAMYLDGSLDRKTGRKVRA